MPLEIVARTEKATIYRDPTWNTGRHVAAITIHDQNIRETGLWVPTDESLAVDGADGFGWRSGRVRHRFRIATDGSRRWYPQKDNLGEYVNIGKPEYRAGLQWQSFPIGTSPSLVTANSLIWIRPNFDLKMSQNWHQIKLEILLKTETARAVRMLQWPFSLTGLTYKDGQILSGSTVVGYLSTPTAWDANGKPIRIIQRYQAGYVQYILNDADMDAAVLPVTVDPTFVDGYGGDVSTYKDANISQYPAPGDTNYGTSADLMTRFWATFLCRTLIQFDCSSIAAGSTCDSATLALLSTYMESTSVAHSVYELRSGRGDWVEAEATWNSYKSASAWATAGCDNTTSDRLGTAIGTFTSPASAPNAVNISLTTTDVEDWFGVSNKNYGLLIKADDETGSYNRVVWSSSDHATTANRPSLTVVYTAAGGATVKNMMLMGVG